MTDTDDSFQIARGIAQAIADATEGIAPETRRLGLAIFVAAEAAAQAEDADEAIALVNAFTEAVVEQLEHMLTLEPRMLS